ncbi:MULTISPECIES: streptogramin lyase [unclassified Thioalkalivibrio]|uniref:Vgb family protein n=1 Tax=unclassified Thioalkalivibrio TaxID=2621013 RepID=UPI00036CB2A9|nr:MULTISPECIES: streptogramin lyase [unclassified Thioalkalivibrio]
MLKFVATALAVPALAMGSATVVADDAEPIGSIQEWEVPWPNTRPRDPWMGPDGRVWFVGQTGHYVATLDPETGEFERFDLESGAGPHTVITNESGAWYAGNRADHIGRIDPETGEIERFELPGDGRRDPHTMDFTEDGNIWFTVQHGNQIGYLDVTSGDITLHDVPTPGSRPYGLMLDGNEQPWVTSFGTNKLATVAGVGEAVEEIELPREDARPRRPTVTDDGRVWYVDFADGYLGAYNPASGEIEEWRTPGEAAGAPYAITTDGEGRVWFSETAHSPNRLIAFDPSTETFLPALELADGGGIVRHITYHGPSNTIWFGADTGTIGRIQLD